MAKWMAIIGASILIALSILLLSLGLTGNLTTTTEITSWSTSTQTTSTTATGSAALVTELRIMSGFHSVVADGPYNIDIVSQGNNDALEINAQSAIMPLIETFVQFQTLYIRRKETFNNQNPIIITLNNTLPLQKIETSGACRIKVTPVLFNDTVILKAHGASYIQVSAYSPNLRLTASGASVIQVGGQATTIWMSAKGASQIRADEERYIAPLIVGTANLDISEASRVLGKYLIAEVIKGKVQGASSVCYNGSPKLDLEITADSSVKPCKVS